MPATPRPASTVILARPNADGSYDVLLTKRPESMAFMGGTYVFPGGALDDADKSPDMAACSAVDGATARDLLGEDIEEDEALGLLCCGLRELYEEAGILLATQGEGPVNPAKVRERYAPHHAEVGHDPTTFAAFLQEEGLRLGTDMLVSHGRLITPEQAPIRFDARFFVAPMPPGQAVMPHPTEVVEWLWISPTKAIERARNKELDIPIPTMAVLQGLSEITGYEQLMQGRHERREIVSAKLSPLVSVVVAPNPGLMTGGGTNTYVVGVDGDVAIIDPAVPDPVYIERLAREAGNRGRVKVVLITHTHIDHIGGVVPLVEQMPTDVAAHESVTDAQFVTRRLVDGETIELGGATLLALHTPGHAANHLCFYLPEERALFAGDVVAGFGTVVISPPDGNLADYMETLERLHALDLGPIYPGHGPVIEDGRGKITEYIEHRRERERQVIDALEAGDTDTKDMVKRIYTDVPEALHPMAERSVLATLEMLEQTGRVHLHDDDSWSLKR